MKGIPEPNHPIRVIAIVGSRRRDTYEDKRLILQALDSIQCTQRDMIISGGCYKGADKFAEEIAEQRGILMNIIEANWNEYGKSAGPIRNVEIANNCDIMIALPASDRIGGTESAISAAYKLGKKVILI